MRLSLDVGPSPGRSRGMSLVQVWPKSDPTWCSRQMSGVDVPGEGSLNVLR